MDKKVSRREILKDAGKMLGLTIFNLGVFVHAFRAGAEYYFHEPNLPILKDNGLAILISNATNGEKVLPTYLSGKFTPEVLEEVLRDLPTNLSEMTDEDIKPILKFFKPVYVASVEKAFRQKANPGWLIDGATKDDLYRAIRAQEIQSIVVFGHGNKSEWKATDGTVDYFDLVAHATAYKEGYFVKHTCGKYPKRGKYIIAEESYLCNTIVNLAKNNNLVVDEDSLEFEEFEHHKGYYTQISFDVTIPEDSSDLNLDLSSLLGLVDDPEEEISTKVESVFDVEARERVKSYIYDLKNFLSNKVVETDFKLGSPVFRDENIFYFEGLADPSDFLKNTFGRKGVPPPSYGRNELISQLFKRFR